MPNHVKDNTTGYEIPVTVVVRPVTVHIKCPVCQEESSLMYELFQHQEPNRKNWPGMNIFCPECGQKLTVSDEIEDVYDDCQQPEND